MWTKYLYQLFFALVFTVLNATAYAQSGDKLQEKFLVKIYPNPVVSEATIKLSDEINFDKSRVSVTFYNVVGKEVYKVQNINKSEVRFNRDQFISGMYIYQLKVDSKTISTGKFTVK